MAPALLLRQVNLLEADDLPPRRCDVRLEGNRLAALGGAEGELPPVAPVPAGEAPVVLEASHLWLAPGLVDPSSVLEDPLLGRAETLDSLAEAARAGGYGTVALLPWGPAWRDRPESLHLRFPAPLRLLLWGAFSLGGADAELSPHADLLAAGALGLAAGSSLPPLALLERGLRLGEMGHQPLLVAPRDASLSREGFVRERVEALRGGWPLDPVLSETLPLQALLGLAEALPAAPLRLMNLSTAEGVALLRQRGAPLPASVSWWHLLADSGRLDPAAEGWRVMPSLGGPGDREALVAGLADGTLTAVAVQHQALDPEERLLPLDQRRPGLAGHGLVLPLLWGELVERQGWSPSLLWRALCWGPCRFLGLPVSRLEVGGSDWILFDPTAPWGECPRAMFGAGDPSRAANRPRLEEGWAEGLPQARGRVRAAGFNDPRNWDLAGLQR
jgi:dihydroorotase